MKKEFFYLTMMFLLFFIISYTYSVFKNTIDGNVTANIKDWSFNVNVNNAVVENDSYKLHLTGTSGSFTINLSTLNNTKGADYTIELIGDSSIKFYKDSNYNNLINNNIYEGSINNNLNKSITIYYKSDSNINSDIYIKTKGIIMEIATMKNGYSWSNGGTEFWNNNYKPYVRTITFNNDLSNLPNVCNEENLCWDVSYSSTQKKKVYGYLIDTGLKDSTDNTKALYNLYIVSETQIFAPNYSSNIFSFYKYENNKDISNLISINFNDNFNTSKVTDMESMFDRCSFLTSLNLNSFNTTNVSDMSYMFYNCSSLTRLDLSKFNTANVTNMEMMFSGCSSLTSLNLISFNTPKVTNMGGMFYKCSSLTSLDLSNFNTVEATDMYWMFSYCKSLTNLDLSSFNTSNITNMQSMFAHCSSLTSLNLNNFNTANVTNMGWMFSECSSIKSLDLSSFNTSNVTNMHDMFYGCSSLTSLNLNSFNTTNVTDIRNMFYDCKSLTNLNLSSFNTANVTDMSSMFFNCLSLTNLNLSSFNTANVTNMSRMFISCTKLTTTINIMSVNTTNYSLMFSSAATASGAKITVNYTSSTSTLVDNMIATKSYNSNVIKGNIIPEHSITITGNDDIKYDANSRFKGSKVTLTSISGNNYVTSFKMNGTIINGNEFIMPDTDVIISDIATIPRKIIESAHDPYPNSQDNVIIGEHTFEGAKSLIVILDYQTESTNYDYFLIYDSNTSTTGINNNKKYGGSTRTQETITINSNYIKITFKSDSSVNNYYGLRAIIIPNY